MTSRMFFTYSTKALHKLYVIGLIMCTGFSCSKKHHSHDPVPASNTYVITLQPGSEGKDALLSGLYTNTSYPDYLGLHARAWTVNGDLSIEKGIMQFDYSSIPTDATVTKATLTLYADTTNNTSAYGHSQLSGSNAWTLKRVTQPWNESSVTWNNAPSTDPSTVIACSASTTFDQAYVLDVTLWVKDEIKFPGSYYGFLMQINNENPYRAINVCSFDHQYASLHPKIVIEYTR